MPHKPGHGTQRRTYEARGQDFGSNVQIGSGGIGPAGMGGGSMGGTNQVINSSPSTVTNILTQDRFNSEIESLISA